MGCVDWLLLLPRNPHAWTDYDPLFSRRSSPLVGSSLTRMRCGYAHPRIDHGRVSWLACVQHASLYPVPSRPFNYSFDYYTSILNLSRCCRKRGSVLLGPLESQTSSLQTVTCPKYHRRKRWEWICFSSRNLLELPQALPMAQLTILPPLQSQTLGQLPPKA